MQFTSELCFDMIKVTKGSHFVKSKVAFLKSTKTATGICPFFYGAYAKKWFAIAAAKQNNISFEKLDTQKIQD